MSEIEEWRSSLQVSRRDLGTGVRARHVRVDAILTAKTDVAVIYRAAFPVLTGILILLKNLGALP